MVLRYGTHISAAVLLLVSVVGVCAQSTREARPDSLFWRISGNGLTEPSYLLGTAHVYDKRVFRFGDSVMPALARARGFAQETRLDSALAVLMASRTFLGDVTFLGYRARRSRGRGTVRDTASDPVFADYPMFLDEYLAYEARRKGASIHGLEPSDRSDEKLDSILGDHWNILWAPDRAEPTLSMIVNAYVDRDLSALREMLRLDRTYVVRSLAPRNHVMASSMHLLMQQRTMFVAVGALHLIGNDNLIDLLRQRGYTVEPVRHAFTTRPPTIADMQHRDDQRRWGPDSAYSIVAPGEVIAIPETECVPLHGITRSVVTYSFNEVSIVRYVPDMEMLGLETERQVAANIGMIDDAEVDGTIVKHKGRTIFMASAEDDDIMELHGVVRMGRKAVAVTMFHKGTVNAEDIFLDMMSSIQISPTSRSKTIGTWDDEASGLRFPMPLPIDRTTTCGAISSFESMDPVNRVNYFVEVMKHGNGFVATSIDDLFVLLDSRDTRELRRDTVLGTYPAVWFTREDDDETVISLAILRSSLAVVVTITAATLDGLQAGVALMDSITLRACCDRPWERRRLFEDHFEYTGPEAMVPNAREGGYDVFEPTTGIVVGVAQRPLGPFEPTVSGPLRRRLESVLRSWYVDDASIESAVFHEDQGMLEHRLSNSMLTTRVLVGVADRNAIIVTTTGMPCDVDRPEIDALLASCIVHTKPDDRPFEPPSIDDLLAWLDQADRGLAHADEDISSHAWRTAKPENVPALLAYLSRAANAKRPSRFMRDILSVSNDLDSVAVMQWARTDAVRMDPRPRLETMMLLAELRSRSGVEALAEVLRLLATSANGFETVTHSFRTHPDLTSVLERQTTDDLVRLAPYLPPLTTIPVVRAQACSAGVALLRHGRVDRTVLYPMVETILARPIGVVHSTDDALSEIGLLVMYIDDEACAQRIRAYMSSADDDIAVEAIRFWLREPRPLAQEAIDRCSADPALRARVMALLTTEEMYAKVPQSFRTRAMVAEASVAARFASEHPDASIRVRPLTTHTRSRPIQGTIETWVAAEVLSDGPIKRYDGPNTTILAVVGPFDPTEEVQFSRRDARCGYGVVPMDNVMSEAQIESLIRLASYVPAKRPKR